MNLSPSLGYRGTRSRKIFGWIPQRLTSGMNFLVNLIYSAEIMRERERETEILIRGEMSLGKLLLLWINFEGARNDVAMWIRGYTKSRGTRGTNSLLQRGISPCAGSTLLFESYCKHGISVALSKGGSRVSGPISVNRYRVDFVLTFRSITHVSWLFAGDWCDIFFVDYSWATLHDARYIGIQTYLFVILDFPSRNFRSILAVRVRPENFETRYCYGLPPFFYVTLTRLTSSSYWIRARVRTMRITKW